MLNVPIYPHICTIIAHQNTDGGFGSNDSTVYETAYAYLALIGVTTNATVLGNAINYLTSTQLTNGSYRTVLGRFYFIEK